VALAFGRQETPISAIKALGRKTELVLPLWPGTMQLLRVAKTKHGLVLGIGNQSDEG
jgi:hypothetical protein